MPFVQWEDKMSVGVDELDVHHQKLLDIMNELSTAIGENKGKEFIGTNVVRLVEYTQYHFDLEAAYFQKFDYVDAQEHIRQHDHFIKRIKDITGKIQSGKEVLSFNVLFFLKDWLVNHIMVSDYKYAQYLKESRQSTLASSQAPIPV